MYAQASEHFPGIDVDDKNKRIYFDSAHFDEQLVEYSEKMADAEAFSLSESYSVVYRRFLDRDLGHYTTIRGQFIGPVSFGFKVTDENKNELIHDRFGFGCFRCRWKCFLWN